MNLDELVVSIALDPKKIVQGTKATRESLGKVGEDSEKLQKNITANGKSMVEAFTTFRRHVIEAGVSFLGFMGIKNFIEDVTESDAAVGRLAKSMGVLPERLAAWEQLAPRFGATKGDIDNAFRTINSIALVAQTFGEVTEKTQRTFALIGINAQAFFKNNMSTEQRMWAIKEALDRQSPQKGWLFANELSLGENFLNIERGVTNGLLNEQVRRNRVDEAATKASQARIDAWNRWINTLQSLGRNILNEVSPPILELLDQLTGWISKNHKLISSNVVGFLKALGTTISNIDWSAVEASMEEIWKWAEKAKDSLGGLVNIMQLVAAAWVGNMLGGPMGALAGVAGMGFYELYKSGYKAPFAGFGDVSGNDYFGASYLRMMGMPQPGASSNSSIVINGPVHVTTPNPASFPSDLKKQQGLIKRTLPANSNRQ